MTENEIRNIADEADMIIRGYGKLTAITDFMKVIKAPAKK